MIRTYKPFVHQSRTLFGPQGLNDDPMTSAGGSREGTAEEDQTSTTSGTAVATQSSRERKLGVRNSTVGKLCVHCLVALLT